MSARGAVFKRWSFSLAEINKSIGLAGAPLAEDRGDGRRLRLDGVGVAVELDPELYLAPAQTLLRKAAASEASSVMVVAHDPGISELASLLSNDGILHMPTCAVARFVWEVDSWSDAITRPVASWSFDTPKSRT